MLDHSVSELHISAGSTSALSAPLNSATTSLDKISEGLLWLGTLSIQTGTSKPLSTWKMAPTILSRSSLADQLLRKAPLTASLSVNRTTRLELISSFQLDDDDDEDDDDDDDDTDNDNDFVNGQWSTLLIKIGNHIWTNRGALLCFTQLWQNQWRERE